MFAVMLTGAEGVLGADAMPTLVVARRRILNMWPQLVHLTVTPPGLSRLSSSSYSVWHFSQRTSMVSRRPSAFRLGDPRYGTTTISRAHLGRPRRID